MTREFLNTLYVMTQGAYLRLEAETAKVEADGKVILQTPLHHIGSIVVFGDVMLSQQLMHKCVSEGRAIAFMSLNGRFLARVVGPVSGNVLLREQQYEARKDENRCTRIAQAIAAGKIHNMRSVLLRAARESEDESKKAELTEAAELLATNLEQLAQVEGLDEVRGHEGQATANYFSVFDHMILAQRTDFKFMSRNRRPPRDRVNALLSFVYAILLNDCVSAAEGVGLDPQLGYLHSIRSGRPALGLDLMEEFRPVLGDRLVLNLINRRQISAEHFEVRPGNVVMLNEEGRKIVLAAYQRRKQREVDHPLAKSKIPLGLVPHLQARILARHLRGDIRDYIPYHPR